MNAMVSPYGGRTCLQAASASGNAELVRLFLHSGAEVNELPAYEHGYTALAIAISNGHSSITNILFAAGASDSIATRCNSFLSFALNAAVEKDDFELVKRLSRRTDPNDLNWYTYLYHCLVSAIRKKSPSLDIVRHLLQVGAIVNRPLVWPFMCGRSEFNPPLNVVGSNVEIARLLIDAGADVNQNDGISLRDAIRHMSLEMVQLLIQSGADVNPAQGAGELSPLKTAIGLLRYTGKGGDFSKDNPLEIVTHLIKAGANVNEAHGGTALEIASEIGDLDIIQLLLRYGADVNARGLDYPTPLQSAMHKGKIELIQLLLDSGADVNVKAGHYGWRECNWPGCYPNVEDRTALQRAVEVCSIEVIQLLLRYGAGVNAAAGDYMGVTALQAASITGRLPIVVMLLEAGADVNGAPCKERGRTALEGAAEWGRLDIVSLLLKYRKAGKNFEHQRRRAVELATENGHRSVVTLLKNH